MFGVALLLGLLFVGAASSSKKSKLPPRPMRKTWYGSNNGDDFNPSPSSGAKPKIGDIIDLVLIDPTQPGEYKIPGSPTGESFAWNFAPVARAKVKWIGVDEEKSLAIGTVVSVGKPVLTDSSGQPLYQSVKPQPGDRVLFE